MENGGSVGVLAGLVFHERVQEEKFLENSTLLCGHRPTDVQAWHLGEKSGKRLADYRGVGKFNAPQEREIGVTGTGFSKTEHDGDASRPAPCSIFVLSNCG